MSFNASLDVLRHNLTSVLKLLIQLSINFHFINWFASCPKLIKSRNPRSTVGFMMICSTILYDFLFISINSNWNYRSIQTWVITFRDEKLWMLIIETILNIRRWGTEKSFPENAQKHYFWQIRQRIPPDVFMNLIMRETSRGVISATKFWY